MSAISAGGTAYLGKVASQFRGRAGLTGDPVANFTTSAAGLQVTFTNTSSDPEAGALTYDWDFGDGGSSTAASPVRTYAASGTYTVTLVVTDASGRTDSVTKTVTV